MIAALPMYDWPEERATVDAQWRAIANGLRRAGIGAPTDLTRDRQEWEVWQAPDLVLGQTCGLPYRSRLHGKVALVGAFDHNLEGAEPGYYYSQIVIRRDDPRQTLPEFDGARLALNAFDSQSGWAAIHQFATRDGIGFGSFHLSGGHRDSAAAVAEHRADIAAIDAVSWRLVCRHMTETAAGLRVLARTPPTPALPLITSLAQDAGELLGAVNAGLADWPDPEGAGGPLRVVAMTDTDYLAVPIPPVPNLTDPAGR